MVSGEITVETRMTESPSGPLPPNIPTHMKLTTATGTLYSSRIPVTRFTLLPKNSCASTKARSGMKSWQTSRITMRSLGWRNTSTS